MKNLVFLTGAGMSAESGISTFRDSGGLWEQYPVEAVASIQGYERDPELVQKFYNERRQQLSSVVPNEGHKLVASLEDKFNVTVITQNVDDLHERAGSQHIIHLHGELTKATSSRNPNDPNCIVTLPEDNPVIHMGDKAKDGSQLRPFIVWFGESVPLIEEAFREGDSADIFVVVGTSLQVQPAASLVGASRAEQNYIIDPHTPRSMAGMNTRIRIINEPATVGMRELMSVLVPAIPR